MRTMRMVQAFVFSVAGLVLVGFSPSVMPACYPASEVLLCMMAGVGLVIMGLYLAATIEAE